MSANGQRFLFNGSKLKICMIFRNTKDLQLQLKSVNIYNYVKMLNPLEKKKHQRFQMEHSELACIIAEFNLILFWFQFWM